MQLDVANVNNSLRRLWWLQPSLLFALVIICTIGAAAVQSDAAFKLFGAPKFVAEKHVLLAMLAVVVFAVGQRLGQSTGSIPSATPPRRDRLIIRWFWLTTAMTFFGYAAWLAVGLKNGFTLGMLREFLTTDDPLFAEVMRDDVFYTVPGVTTFAQFGVAVVPLGLWLWFRGYSQCIWPVVLLVPLAALRALVFSERLAFVELVVPGLIVVLRMGVLGRPLAAAHRWALQLLPVAAVAALLLFFGTFEYFRSWRFHHNDFDSYSQFIVWRVTGYYTLAHNNGAMALETQPAYPLPYSTLQMFWRVPGLSKTPLGYANLTGIDPEARHRAMLERYGTPELNNEGGLFQPVLDYGVAGYAVFWCLCGFVSGRLYRSFLVGTLVGVTLYPLVFLAILETPRILYLSYTRALPALLALAVVVVLTHRAPYRTIARAPAPATA